MSFLVFRPFRRESTFKNFLHLVSKAKRRFYLFCEKLNSKKDAKTQWKMNWVVRSLCHTVAQITECGVVILLEKVLIVLSL